MANTDKKDIHTISFLVANKPGVLVRVALAFAKRGFNIDSLVVSPTTNAKFSRMTITAQGSPETLEQIIKQTSKLIDVIRAEEHSEKETIHRELALIKLKHTPSTKPIILKQAEKFKAKLISEEESFLIIEHLGTTAQLDELEAILKKYNVVELVRSGKLVIAKGRDST
ncbi:MAG: acetolactate synthase small subunit [Candidatus Omnitrophica bacterium]|nr:acetolactate synthase small subunit [Candidatus Omnitrophota bacterium]